MFLYVCVFPFLMASSRLLNRNFLAARVVFSEQSRARISSHLEPKNDIHKKPYIFEL